MRITGLNPRMPLSASENKLVYERSGGHCQRCGSELGDDYHNAHLASLRNGGETTLENMQAWCARCNLALGGNDAIEFPEISFRDWQKEALPRIAEEIFCHGFATLQAAPGAGKTLFAAALFKKLNEAGYIDRMTVIVPNTALLQQWRSELGRLDVRLDTRPRNGAIERRGLAGVVTTYQSLPSSARVHAVQQNLRTTLVVLDEVHHVATDAMWGWAVREMLGDVVTGQIHASGVLNMTGTLFRSRPTERISTVRYERGIDGGAQKLQARADYSVPTRELIQRGELRPPDLYSFSSYARYLDVTKGRYIRNDVTDLDDEHRNSVVRQAVASREWIQGFARDAYRLLGKQLESLEWKEPLKLLFVASDQTAARDAAAALNKAAGKKFAHLVTSDEPGALTRLRIAKNETAPCGIVTVRMITEGFDCPQVSTIAYASNVTAQLTISQMMARAMRVTEVERSKQIIPAKILVPDHPDLLSSFAASVRNAIPLADDMEKYVLARGLNENNSEQAHQLLDISHPQLRSAMALDQEEQRVTPAELSTATMYCRSVAIPETFALRLAVVLRRNSSGQQLSEA